MSDSALPSSHARALNCRGIPSGELGNGEMERVGAASSGQNKKKANTPCLRIQLRKNFRRKQKERADSFICSY